jgi:mRNA interferase MazF
MFIFFTCLKKMNHYISTVIVAPMTSKGRNCPTRIPCTLRETKGQVVLDQIRTVDKSRLVKKLGILSKSVQQKTLAVLQEMFAD